MGRVDYQAALAAAERHRRAKSLQTKVSSVETDAAMLDQRRDFLRPGDRVFFESIIEGSDLLPIRYLEIGQLAARAVGRIEVASVDGRGVGFATGFLVAPGLMMTNQHVLRTGDLAQGATVTFDAEDRANGDPRAPRVFRLAPSDLFVANDELDFALVAVNGSSLDGTPLSEFGYLRLFEQTGKITRDEFATIVQHPNGRQKHMAARNNRVRVYVYDQDLTAEERTRNNFLYYETDTLRGSSGSPVFSDQWYVVALHRRGVPATRLRKGEPVIVRRDGKIAGLDDDDDLISYESNEGTRISRVLAELESLSKDGAYLMQAFAAKALTRIRAAAGEVGDGPVTAPVSVPTILRETGRPRSTMGVLSEFSGRARVPMLAPETLEITRRDIDDFPDERGYDPDFLVGFSIPLPRPKAVLKRALARRIDKPGEFLLPFRHFTSAMHARRRLPVFVAVNISGRLRPSGGMPARPQWSYDPRIDEDHQPDDSIFSNVLQRGHLAAREYIYWGRGAAERREADVHSFTLTNVCPQVARFNGGGGEWFRVEREVVAEARAEGARITEFVGPIFRANDPLYDSLRSPRSRAQFHTRVRIPFGFWKIIAWVENGLLEHRAFLLDQEDEVAGAGQLEIDIDVPEGVEETTIEEIEELTDLQFGGF